MGFLESLTKGKKPKPRRTVLTGVHGIGKSTWASLWPDPVFIQTEDGASDLDVTSGEVCKDFATCYGQIMEVGGGEHEFKTLVLDSADWAELLIHKHVCMKASKESITDFDWGQGYGSAAKIFNDVLSALSQCREIGMHVVVLCHTHVSKFASPLGDSYDRYSPKLHKLTSALLQEWADEVLFANYDTTSREVDGKDSGRSVGVSSGTRMLYTTERPGWVAKNRLGLPPQMLLEKDSLAEYSKYLPKLS